MPYTAPEIPEDVQKNIGELIRKGKKNFSYKYTTIVSNEQTHTEVITSKKLFINRYKTKEKNKTVIKYAAFPITDSVGKGSFGLATAPALCFDRNGKVIPLVGHELETVVKFPNDKASSKEFFDEYKKMPYRCRAGFTPGRTGIKQKWFPGEELLKLIDNGSIYFYDERQKCLLTIAVLEAILKQVTRLGYIHLDLKPANIIVKLPDNGTKPWVVEVNVIDYAFAEMSEGVYPPQGTPLYIAPELVDKTPGKLGQPVFFDNKVDVYSAALTVLDIYNTDWHSDNSLFWGLVIDKSPLPSLQQNIPEGISEVLEGMLIKQPGARLSLEQSILQLKKLAIKNELKQDPIFNEENLRFLENKCLAWIDQIYSLVILEKSDIPVSNFLNEQTELLDPILASISQLSRDIQAKWHPGSKKRDLFNAAIDDYQTAIFRLSNDYMNKKGNESDFLASLEFCYTSLEEVLCMHRKPTRDKALHFFKKESFPKSYKIFQASNYTPNKIKDLLVESVRSHQAFGYPR